MYPQGRYLDIEVPLKRLQITKHEGADECLTLFEKAWKLVLMACSLLVLMYKNNTATMFIATRG